MPLKDFIEETMKLTGYRHERKFVVQQAQAFEIIPGPNESTLVTQFNDSMTGAAPQ